MEEKTSKVLNITEDPDSINIGSASKGGAVKVYGDMNKLVEFKKKIDNAKEIMEYARANLSLQ